MTQHPCVTEEPLEKPDGEKQDLNPWERLNDVRQLEMLARAHTLLALVGTACSSHHRNRCLLACALYQRIWKVGWAPWPGVLRAVPIHGFWVSTAAIPLLRPCPHPAHALPCPELLVSPPWFLP